MGSAHKNLILSELLPTVFGQLEMLYGESRLGGAIWGIPAKTWSRHRVWMAGPDYVNQDDREVRIVFRVKFVAKAAGMLAAVAFSVALLASPIHAGEQAHGQGSYLLGPGMPGAPAVWSRSRLTNRGDCHGKCSQEFDPE